jgi:hypothetical protein
MHVGELEKPLPDRGELVAYLLSPSGQDRGGFG